MVPSAVASPGPDEVEMIRRHLLVWRRRLGPAAVAAQSRDAGQVASAAIEAALGLIPTRVCSYVAKRGEIDPAAVTSCWWPSPEVALPLVAGERLEFLMGAPSTATGAFGTEEPVGGIPVGVEWAQVVLVPVVAFGDDGTRVGHGKGFYDRALAGLTGVGNRPLLVGLAYDEQEITGLRPAPWDVPMDAIATPTRWRTARPVGTSDGDQPVAD